MIARIDQDDTLPIDQVVHGECLSVMHSFPDNSVDSIVCDPPCGIGFMSAKWDTFDGKTHKSRKDEKEARTEEGKWLEGRGTLPYGFSPSIGRTKNERENFIAWLAEIMTEALRCLKPGGHALVWSLPRTSHWTGLALEQAGFEMRDCLYHTQAQDSAMAAFEASLTETQRDALARLIDSQEAPSSFMHIFGQGFPKSANISAMIDKHFHAEREVIGPKIRLGDKKPYAHNPTPGNEWNERYGLKMWRDPETAPSTDDAKRFAGYGSALKPACENWWLCRKPLSEKTLAANCLKWGTGGLNIDKSRVGYASDGDKKQALAGDAFKRKDTSDKKAWARPWMEDKEHVERLNRESKARAQSGRFPSNVLFSHSLFCTDTVCDASCPVLALEQQSGVRKSGGGLKYKSGRARIGSVYGHYNGPENDSQCEASTGTASRFFHCFTPDVPFLYCAKSSRSERNLGCEELPEHERHTQGRDEVKWIDRLDGKGKVPVNARIQPAANIHPTVKSVSLMKYLVSLITPDNGIVLDMFAGSGSTLCAAIAEGYHFIGIEQSDTPQEPYCTIARARIAHAMRGA